MSYSMRDLQDDTTQKTKNVWNAPVPQVPRSGGPQWWSPTYNKAVVNPINEANGIGYKAGVFGGLAPVGIGLASDPLVQGGVGALATGQALQQGFKGIQNGVSGFLNDSTGNSNGNGNGNPNPNSSAYDDLVNRTKNQQFSGAFDDKGNPVAAGYALYRPSELAGVSNGYQDMVKEGTGKGLSNWGQAAYDRSRADQTYAIDDARGQAMGDAAGNMNQLAMQGGLESGAAENMMRSGSQAANKARTELYRQGSMDRMGIDVSDAARKDDMRTKGLAGGMDVSKYISDMEQFNVSNALADRYKKFDFDQNKLSQEGNIVGSKATSDAMIAQANAAGKGGLGDLMNPQTALNPVKNLWQNTLGKWVR